MMYDVSDFKLISNKGYESEVAFDEHKFLDIAIKGK